VQGAPFAARLASWLGDYRAGGAMRSSGGRGLCRAVTADGWRVGRARGSVL